MRSRRRAARAKPKVGPKLSVIYSKNYNVLKPGGPEGPPNAASVEVLNFFSVALSLEQPVDLTILVYLNVHEPTVGGQAGDGLDFRS